MFGSGKIRGWTRNTDGVCLAVQKGQRHYAVGSHMQRYGNVDAEQDIFRRTYGATIVFYKKNFHGHLFSQTDSFPDHAWLFTERGSRVPVDNFGRDFYCDGLADKVNDDLQDYSNLVNKLSASRQPALREHLRWGV